MRKGFIWYLLCKCNNFLSGSAVGRQHLLSKSCFYLKTDLLLKFTYSVSVLFCVEEQGCVLEPEPVSRPSDPLSRRTQQSSSTLLWRHITTEKNKELPTIVSFLFCRKPSKSILVSLTAMLVLGVHVYLYLCVWLPAHKRIICSLLYSSGSQKSLHSWTSGSYFQSLQPHVCCKGHLLQMFKNSFPVLYVF